ncbi:MAG TPA: recombinase family protein [Nevskiaceae bacterium]
MLVGYLQVSEADAPDVEQAQRDALIAAGVDAAHIHEDHTAGPQPERPGLQACLAAVKPGDTLVVWKLGRMGHDLRTMSDTLQGLRKRGVAFKALAR